MNKEQAAEFIGASPRTIERYTQQGKLSPTYVKGIRGQVADYDEEQLQKLKAELETPVYPRQPLIEQAPSAALVPTNSAPNMAGFVEALAASIMNRQAAQPSLSDLSAKLTLKLAEASQLSGLSKDFLREAIKEKKLKAAKRGRGWNIKRSDLEAYVKKL